MNNLAQEPAAPPVPRWVAPTFAALATLTVPWTMYLAVALPKQLDTRHYRLSWVGFDLGLVLLLLSTAALAWMGHRQVGIAATATATFLVVDAWFDVVTSPPRDEWSAILSAVLVELPLAMLCLWIALHVDRLIANRLRYLTRGAERAAAVLSRLRDRPVGVGVGARIGRAGARIEQVGANVTDAGVRAAEAEVREAEAEAEAEVEAAEASGHRQDQR